MGLKELEPGRYKATVASWGIKEVEKLGELLAVIEFKLETGDSVYYESFFKRRDGEPNKHTLQTIQVCGFSGKTLDSFVDDDALDKERELQITLERDEGGFIKVKWVNEPGDGARELMDSGVAAKKLKGLKLDGVLMKIKADGPKAKTKTVKNHAPGMPPRVYEEEEIPF